jgi:NAD(P) transhydrogenase
MVTALNIKVTVIEARATILDFVDREMIDSLMFFMRQRGAAFGLGRKVLSVGYDEKTRIVASFESGREVHGDALLYTVGHKTNADLLNLEAVGLSADDRGRTTVNEFFETAVTHIYAAATWSAFRRWTRKLLGVRGGAPGSRVRVQCHFPVE